MGLLGKVLGRVVPSMRMKEKARGQAQVVACSGYHGRGVYQTCTMQLVLTADGVPATSVEHTELVHRSKWPRPGVALPLAIDRSDPTRFYIEWGEVMDSRDRAQQQADEMAAAMRGPGGPGAMPPGAIATGGMNVVNLGGRDLSDLSDEQRAKLQMLGIDPSLLQGQTPVAPPQGAVADADQDVDDQLARLAKLGQLRDAGVLTPEEFEQQKRRVLGDR